MVSLVTLGKTTSEIAGNLHLSPEQLQIRDMVRDLPAKDARQIRRTVALCVYLRLSRKKNAPSCSPCCKS